MSVRPADASRRRVRRHGMVVAGLLGLALAATGCQSGERATSAQGGDHAVPAADSPTASPTPSAPPVSAATVSVNLSGRGVTVDRVLKVAAHQGTLTKVSVQTGKKGGKRLAGSLSQDGTTWTASARLEPDTRYRVRAVAVDHDKIATTQRASFRSQALTLDQQTYPSFVPVDGDTVGVGMPVIVRFDVPVRDRASIERHLKVTNTSHQKGAWHWISDNEVHWRPVHYWKPGTDVTVTADVNSIPAGHGIYGQLSRTSSFHVGRSMVSKVNAQTDQMRVFIDRKLARTIPITTGKPGFTTRSGTKVIVEKFRHKRMNSETIGIDPNSADGYDLSNVEYAMRITYSGEFLHAAPWSVGSQGSANVSHGCTGMSTANAEWLYSNSMVGDPVEFTGTDRYMTLDNGYGDWNLPFKEYKQGSALAG
jgi:lipoprotein-anchoring transpeptidase ErfK/SrfK